MLKRFIQSLIPSFILNKYKVNQYLKILRDFDVMDQPDLLVVERLVDENSTFVDIGANIGLYTKYVSPLVKQVKSFEPVPFTFGMLSKNVTKFELENVALNQIAISSSDGEAVIDIPIQGGARNYYRASLELGVSDKLSEMKINGASSFLESAHCAWLIEVDGNPDEENSSAFEVFRKMEEAGFTGYFFDGKELQKRRKGNISVNYFFLKKRHLDTLSASGIVISS
jgi:FkbM family methyltransferase